MMQLFNVTFVNKELVFCWQSTGLGRLLLAASPTGLCYAAFDDGLAMDNLFSRFPGCSLVEQYNPVLHLALLCFHSKGSLVDLRLEVTATPFQFAVWKALLDIPSGQVVTYGEIAVRVGHPKAVRAVGTAVGANPLALFVPCHRVVPQLGGVGNYRWGQERKKQLLEVEKQNLHPGIWLSL